MTSDHAEAEREGRDGLDDIDDWLETVEQFTVFGLDEKAFESMRYYLQTAGPTPGQVPR